MAYHIPPSKKLGGTRPPCSPPNCAHGQDSEFATGYGYPKTAFKWEPDTDPDIRKAFVDILRIQTFGKSGTLRNHLFILVSSEPSCLLCQDFETAYYCVSMSTCDMACKLVLIAQPHGLCSACVSMFSFFLARKLHC